MKKVILALAVVSVSFAACNNGETKETPKTDSAAVTPAPTPAPATADTTKKADTTAKAAAPAAAKADSAKK